MRRDPKAIGRVEHRLQETGIVGELGPVDAGQAGGSFPLPGDDQRRDLHHLPVASGDGAGLALGPGDVVPGGAVVTSVGGGDGQPGLGDRLTPRRRRRRGRGSARRGFLTLVHGLRVQAGADAGLTPC